MAKIIGVSKFERLFREAAGLDVDKNDLARLNDFVRQKVYDLLLAAQATAKDNQRDVIQLHDLPLTLGFKESMRAFDGLDTALELQPILDQLVALPPLDLAYSYEMEAELPRLVGGLTVALAAHAARPGAARRPDSVLAAAVARASNARGQAWSTPPQEDA